MATKHATIGDEVYIAGQDVRDLRRQLERAGHTDAADKLLEAECLISEAADLLLDDEDEAQP